MSYLGPLKSELKTQILLSLLNREKKLMEIRVDIESSGTTILHAIKELEGLNLTKKSGGIYTLTSLGIMEAQLCRFANSAATVIEKFKDFWLLHDVSSLPIDLILRIGALKDSTIVQAETLELGKVYNFFIEILMKSEKVTGISPIFHPIYVPVIEHLLSQDKPVELIVTSGVLSKTLASAKVDRLKESLGNNKLKIYIREDLKVALTVTDTSFSLGLFKINGEYDDNMDLISFNNEAIEWGQDLFQNYLKKSTRVDPEAII